MRDFDPDDDRLNDDDWPDDDDEPEVVDCPHCGEEVYEDAEQCSHCGQYIVQSTSPWGGKPWWWIILGLAGIAAVIWLLIP